MSTPPSSSTPMPCDRCGQPHARCIGHRRDGEPCTQWRMTGQLVCKMHGGLNPQAMAKAAERVTEARAEAEVQRLWVGLENATPVENPVKAMQQLAGALGVMVERLGNKVSELPNIETGEALSQLRAVFVAFEKVEARYQAALETMNRLGIAQQLVQLERDQARSVGLGVTDGLDAGAVVLVAADVAPAVILEHREAFTRVFLARVREAELGAAGAVAS